GGRTGKRWNREQTGSDQSDRKNEERQIAGDRPQCFGGLLGGLDVCRAVRVQRDGGGKYDEKHHGIGSNRACSDVGASLADFTFRRVDALRFGRFALFFLLLDFL